MGRTESLVLTTNCDGCRLKLLEKESTDCFIQSLTEEIFETAFAKGYHTLCNTQAFPHSVQWAKAKMIEVIEVRAVIIVLKICTINIVTVLFHNT